MRFLALHGWGTNSQARPYTHSPPLRTRRRPHLRLRRRPPPLSHVAHLHEGTTPTDSFYNYLDSSNVASCSHALDLLDAYIAAERPFDGVFAVSQGDRRHVVFSPYREGKSGRCAAV
ncbi:hypothetical protein BBP40_012781 [Aspergillus hancockii]|nr:hypothetical protein BBP40_012781 [Aspergillus hancockii]